MSMFEIGMFRDAIESMCTRDNVRNYLRRVAEEIVEDLDCQFERDEIYKKMTQEEREFVNEIVELVFGEYL